MKQAALNGNASLRLNVWVRKHLAWTCFSHCRVYWNRLAVFLVLHCAVGLGAGLAAEAEDAAKAGALKRQVDDLYQAGKYQEAIPIARQLLELREKMNGPEHPSTAPSVNNLAELYRAMGDYAKAEPLYRRALAIKEKALGAQASRHRHQPQQPGGALLRDGRLRQGRTALSARLGDQ